MVKSLTAVLASCLGLSGCDQVAKVAEAAKPLPKLEYEVNLSSPDNALKSWWRFLDARDKLVQKDCIEYDKIAAEVMTFGKVSTGEVAQALSSRLGNCELTVYNREIKEIKQETDTRAIAFVKITNATPSTVDPTPEQKKRRIEGEEYKYLIEKEGAEWKVSQVYEYESSYKYLDLESPWNKAYKEYQPSYPVYVFSQQ